MVERRYAAQRRCSTAAGEPPLDGARVAMSEIHAQAACQVPGPARDVRPPVDDRNGRRPAVCGIPERDERAARQCAVGDTAEGCREGEATGGPVSVEAGAMP